MLREPKRHSCKRGGLVLERHTAQATDFASLIVKSSSVGFFNRPDKRLTTACVNEPRQAPSFAKMNLPRNIVCLRLKTKSAGIPSE